MATKNSLREGLELAVQDARDARVIMSSDRSVETRHGSFYATQEFNSVRFRMNSKSSEIHRFRDIASELEKTESTICIDITGSHQEGNYGFEFRAHSTPEKVRKAAGEFIRIYDSYMAKNYPGVLA